MQKPKRYELSYGQSIVAVFGAIAGLLILVCVFGWTSQPAHAAQMPPPLPLPEHVKIFTAARYVDGQEAQATLDRVTLDVQKEANNWLAVNTGGPKPIVIRDRKVEVEIAGGPALDHITGRRIDKVFISVTITIFYGE